MFDSAAIEVAVGLIFVYFIFSLVCSKVNEWVAGALRWRAHMLQKSLCNLLDEPKDDKNKKGKDKKDKDDKSLANEFFGHATVKALVEPKGIWGVLANIADKVKKSGIKAEVPSYLTSDTFSTVIVSVLAPVGEDVVHGLTTGGLPPELGPVATDTGIQATGWDPAAAHHSIDAAKLPPADHQRLHRLVKAAATLAEVATVVGALPATAQARLTPMVDAAGRDFGGRATEALRQAVDQLPQSANKAKLLWLLESARPVGRLAGTVGHLPDGHPLKRPLVDMIDRAGDDIEAFRANLERFFDDAMDRVSGWYKRKVQWALALYALVVSVAFNVDTVAIGRTLWTDPTVRAGVDQLAQGYTTNDDDGDTGADDDTSTPTTVDLETATNDLRKQTGLPLGWKQAPWEDFGDRTERLPAKAAGLALTALALTLGAPFWFDALNKVSQLRSTGTKPKPKSKSK